VLAKLKVLCHKQGFKVGCYFGGRDTSFGVKTLRIQCSCGRPQKKSDKEDRHFNSRHSCLGCKWFRTVIPVERGPDTPAVTNAATGLPNRVYPTCKWMVSDHAGSTHCEDHTGHCKVPHNHLAGINTETVQTIINEHGLLDSISSLQDRILRMTGQYFSWRRLRHMVKKKHETEHLGAAGLRPPRPGKSQELMDWLVLKQNEGALKFTALTMDFEEMDAPAQEPPPAAPLQQEVPSIFARILSWWNRPVPPPAPPHAPPPAAPPSSPDNVDARGRKKRTKKKKTMLRTKNGRHIDANRIVTIDGVKKILLGVAWVTTQELAMFQLVNEFKLKCLAFIGKDPDNSIFTICRMYIPNESTETFDWAINFALPFLLTLAFLLKVRLIITDDCNRMGPVLDDACRRDGNGCLRNAQRALCTFHILNRDYNQDLIGYGHEDWFRIFRSLLWGLQGSETNREKDERYTHILSCLQTWDALGSAESEARKKALNFLAKKWRKRHLWILVYFSETRHFLVRTTSFVEGEWGSWGNAHLNLSHLNSLLAATTKMMKWRVTRHLRQCAALAQAACTQLSREPSPASKLDSVQFQMLDRWLTNAARDAIEEQYELASILGACAVTHFLTSRFDWCIMFDTFLQVHAVTFFFASRLNTGTFFLHALTEVYHVDLMKWEVRAQKIAADDADVDGAHARSQEALRRRQDSKHSNANVPNAKNSKAGKAAARRRRGAPSESASSSSSEAASSPDTSSDSEDEEDDDIARALHAHVEPVGEVDAAEYAERTKTNPEEPAPNADGIFHWRHRRFVKGRFHNGRLVLECTCRMPRHSLQICRHIICMFFSIFGKHILDASFIHMRSMRLWYRLAVTGQVKKIPSNWDDAMQLPCVPSIVMPEIVWQAYLLRCPVQAAPACESFIEQESDYAHVGGDERDGSERDGLENSDWLQQYKNLGLQLLQACGQDQEMRKQVLDHLEEVVTDVGLMSAERSAATRESGARLRPMYERRQ
jgi:hypothetical protein